METFEELQVLWQKQTTAPRISVEDLMRHVRGHSRKHLTIFAVKTTAVAVLTGVMLAVVWGSPAALAGALLVAAGAVVTLGVDWMAHVSLARLEFTAPAAGFASTALEKLRRLARPRPVQYAGVLAGPMAGLNVMEAALLHGVLWEWRLAAHLFLSMLAIVAGWGGLRVRARRFERETRPLIERLEAFSAGGAEGSE
jgi:hypothetical protein